MRARTGQWEPWVSNHPGPPGPRLSKVRFETREGVTLIGPELAKVTPAAICCANDPKVI